MEPGVWPPHEPRDCSWHRHTQGGVWLGHRSHDPLAPQPGQTIRTIRDQTRPQDVFGHPMTSSLPLMWSKQPWRATSYACRQHWSHKNGQSGGHEAAEAPSQLTWISPSERHETHWARDTPLCREDFGRNGHRCHDPVASIQQPFDCLCFWKGREINFWRLHVIIPLSFVIHSSLSPLPFRWAHRPGGGACVVNTWHCDRRCGFSHSQGSCYLFQVYMSNLTLNQTWIAGQDFTMSSLGELWDSLRRAGLEELAPQLVRHGITILNQLVLRAEDLHSAGLLRWQLEAILAASASLTAGSEEATQPDHRPDLPSRQTSKRANLEAALEAATPNQRQKSLQDLDRDILARSTHPAIEARIRTYMAICRAAFPLDTTNVRCFGASLKAGGYKSSAVYYQAVMSHQQRTFKTQIPPIVKQCVRDCIRSIQRGLGVSQLKDAFNGLLIGNIEPTDDGDAFSFNNVSHCTDMAVIGLWFMLREAEMANARARARDIKLEGRKVLFTIPLHKTDPLGKFTVRALSCSCNIRTHNLCVWHSS